MKQRLEREIRMHRFGPIAAEQSEMVHLARRAGLDHQARAGAQALATRCWWIADKASNAGIATRFAIDEPVGHYDDRIARAHRVFGLSAQRRKPCLDRLFAPREGIGDIELERAELAAGVAIDVPDLLHLEEIEHRLADLNRSGGFISSMPRRFGLGPIKDTSEVTSSSRIGSIGGLVTWAKSCLK